MGSHSRSREKRRCEASGKRRFRDHREAVEALHRAATQRRWAAEDAEHSRRQEVRSYRCKACRGWHLTSMATPPPWLEQGSRESSSAGSSWKSPVVKELGAMMVLSG